MKLITNKSKNLLYCISVEGNVTVQFGTSYAVATQRTADSASVNTFKIQGWDGTKYTGLAGANIAIGKLTTTFTTPSTTGFKLIRFGLNGASIDTLCRCEMDLKPSTTYTFTCNFTNITQGSISWKDMMLVEGSTVGDYEPYSYNLLDKWKYHATQTLNGVTFTNNDDGSWTVNGTATQKTAVNFFSDPMKLSKGDKICLSSPIDIESYGKFWYEISVQYIDGSVRYFSDVYNGVFSLNNDVSMIYGCIVVGADETVSGTTIKPTFYDLTLMYGEGNEPTTVNQFYTDHPELKVSPLGFIGLKNIEISNKNIKRLKYVTTTRNLFDVNNLNSYTPDTLPIETAGVYNGNIIARSAPTNSTSRSSKTLQELCPNLKVGKTYILSFETTATNASSDAIYLYTSDTYWAKGTSRTITTNDLNSGVYFYANYPDLTVATISHLQIEEGSTVTSYVPYGYLDLGIIPSNSGYILDKYNNLTEELLEENIEKDNINYHIPDKTNILLNKVEGNTKKVVQLLDKSKYGTVWNHDGINWTPYVAYGTVHCVGKNTGTQYNSFHLTDSWNMDDIVFDDHKYILLTGLKQTYPSFEAGWYCGYSDEDGTTDTEWYSSTGIDQENLNVFTIKKHNYTWKRIELRVVYGNEDTLDVWWTPQLFDLTAMYGRGNEPTTLSQFKQDYPDFFGNIYKGVFPTTISQLSLSNENILNLKDAFGDKSSSLLTTFQGKRCIKFDKNHNISYNTFLPSLTNYSLQFNVYNTGYSASFCGLFVTDKYTNVDSTVRRYCSTQTYNQWVTLKYENVNFNAIGWYQYITGDEEIYIDIDSWCLSVGSSSKDIVYKDDKIDLLNNYELNAIKNPSDGKLYQDYLEVIDNNNGTYTLKKIQYIQKLVLDGNINWTQSGTNTSGKYRFAYEINAISGSSVNTSGPIYCNKIKYPSDGEGSSYGCVESCSCGTYLYFYDNEHNTLPSDFKSYVKSLYDSGDPIIVWYAVETPTETIISSDLTYNQVSALRTNNGCLKVIGNDNDLLVQPNVVIKENFMYKVSV
jgi:hypothetical protein